MAKLVSIHTIGVDEVQQAIKAALSNGLSPDMLDDFLATVDWSGTHESLPPVADLLGQMEGWALQYATGEISDRQYAGHLLSLLPHGDRAGGRIDLMMRALNRPRPAFRLDRSEPRPQTGSGAPPRLETTAPESNTVLHV
jgi:hypothetical protein